MMHSIRGHFFFARIAAVTLAFSSPFANAVVVKAPCTDSGELGFRNCQEYLVAGSPAIAAKASPTGEAIPASPGMLTLITQTIQNQINPKRGDPNSTFKGYYQHVDPSTDGIEQAFGPTLCNPVPGKFTPQPEGIPFGTKNQVNESCGKPVNISIRYSVSTFLGCATSDPRPVPVKFHKEYDAASPLNSPGLLEDGLMRGAIVQATTCFHEQIVGEIKSKHQLTVDNSSGCYAIANDFRGLSEQMGGLTASLKSQPNIKDILSCKKDFDPSSGTEGKDAGQLRQSAQQLCAARAALETMFGHLATCEILARAQKSYVNSVGTAQGQAAIIDMIQNGIGKTCGDRCTNRMSWCNIIPARQVEQCVNQCYQNSMPAAIRDHILKKWKSDGSQCDLSMSFESGMWMIGMVELLGGRKRRNKKAMSKKSAMKKDTMALMLLVLVASLAGGSLGCAEAGSVTATGPEPTSGPCAGIVETKELACCANPSPSCSEDTVGTGSITSHTAAAAEAGSTGALALASANRLLGRDGTVADNGGVLAKGEAASAGDISSLGQVGKKEGSLPNRGARPNFGPGGKGAGGSGAGGSATGNSLGSSFGSLTTSPSSGGADGVSGSSGDQGLGGSYAANSAAATAEGGMGLYARGAGGAGLEGGEGGSATEESFTPEDAGALGKIQGTEGDPEDYFTRLGLADNLFKVVERRYRQKSTVWTTEALRAGKLQ